MKIVNSKSSLESEWYCKNSPNLLESEFELSIIRLGTPNRLSLVHIETVTRIFLQFYLKQFYIVFEFVNSKCGKCY